MRVLIADGHPHFRDALAGVLLTLQPSAEMDMVDDYPSLVGRLRAKPYGLVIADLTLHGLQGLAEIVEIGNLAGDGRITVVANGHSRDIHRQARVCGVAGLIEKTDPPERISRTLAMVLRGGLAFPDILAVPAVATMAEQQQGLTTRQLKVLGLLTTGKSNKQIAKDLSLSPNTVKAHVSEILRKLEMNSRGEVTAMARQPLQVLQAAD